MLAKATFIHSKRGRTMLDSVLIYVSSLSLVIAAIINIFFAVTPRSLESKMIGACLSLTSLLCAMFLFRNFQQVYVQTQAIEDWVSMLMVIFFALFLLGISMITPPFIRDTYERKKIQQG